METRTLFGLKMQQQRNNAVINESLLTSIVSKQQEVQVSHVLNVVLSKL